MRILVHLPSRVRVFCPDARQLSSLRERLVGHVLVDVETQAELLAALPEAEAVVVWRFAADWYSTAPRLRHVCTPSAGRELVEPDPSGRCQLHFGSFHGKIMAESLLAMLLFMVRRLGDAVAAGRQHRWDHAPYQHTKPLAGQTALIVGYGAIGRHLAQLLTKLGLLVYGVKRDPKRGSAGVTRVFSVAELGMALPLADHIICVLPGDSGSDQLLGAAAFACMKPTACVYNLGRGNAIDSVALLEAIRSRRIAGAFLDVVPEEPLPAASPLWDAPNVYLLPHASAMRSDYLDLYFEELATLLVALEPTRAVRSD